MIKIINYTTEFNYNYAHRPDFSVQLQLHLLSVIKPKASIMLYNWIHEHHTSKVIYKTIVHCPALHLISEWNHLKSIITTWYDAQSQYKNIRCQLIQYPCRCNYDSSRRWLWDAVQVWIAHDETCSDKVNKLGWCT